jgi:transposase
LRCWPGRFVMDVNRWRGESIFLYRDPIDLRKGIDGLSAIVATELGRHPADRCLYAFTNRGRDKVKLLVWHLNGFWVLYKRLDRQRFQWPDWFEGQSVTLSAEQLDQLLDGFNLNGMRPHRPISYAHAA